MAISAIFNILLMIVYLAPYSTTMPSVIQGHELKLSQSCFNKGYCVEKHNLYPQNLINKLLNQRIVTVNKNYMTEAADDGGRDTVDGFAQKSSTRPKRNTFDFEDDCETNMIGDRIYEIVDRNNRTRVVVQSERHLEQLIDIKECINPGRISTPSAHFDHDIILNYHLRCVQQTLNYKFLVLNLDWSGFEMVESKNGIPVDCYCVIRGDA